MDSFKPSDMVFNAESDIDTVTDSDIDTGKYFEWVEMKQFLMRLVLLNTSADDGKQIFISNENSPDSTYNFLSSIFPNIEFHIYSTRDGIVNSRITLNKDNIKIFPDPLNKENLDKYKGKRTILFWNKRKTISSSFTDNRSNLATVVAKENEDFKNIVTELNPEYAMCNYMIPNDGVDEYSFLAGTLVKQPFSKPDSKETKLMVKKQDKYAMYNYKYGEYRLAMKMHHAIDRSKRLFLNPITGEEDLIWKEQLDNSYDHTYLLYAIKTYYGKIGVEATPELCIAFIKQVMFHLKGDQNVDDMKTFQRLRLRKKIRVTK